MNTGTGTTERQRFLTNYEIADFMARHPVVAAQVIATKSAMVLIGYDQLATPPEWYEVDVNIGLIGPSGISVPDSKYGNVVIQPAPNGEMYFSGWTTVRPNVIDAPAYESPTGNNPTNMFKDVENLLIMGFAGLLLYGLVVSRGRSRS